MAESTTARLPETGLIPVIGSGQRRSVKVAALGGGHGLSGTLSAL